MYRSCVDVLLAGIFGPRKTQWETNTLLVQTVDRVAGSEKKVLREKRINIRLAADRRSIIMQDCMHVTARFVGHKKKKKQK